jgi:hypothetical protein
MSREKIEACERALVSGVGPSASLDPPQSAAKAAHPKASSTKKGFSPMGLDLFKYSEETDNKTAAIEDQSKEYEAN